MSIAFANQPTLLSLQGKLTNTSTGAKIISADLRVNITDSNDNLVFNHSFSNAVSNGMFDLLLGSVYYLNLSYNEDYNLSIYVGDSDTPVGGPYWFRGGQGQIGSGDIASTESYTFSNVSVTGNFSIDSNMSVDAGTLFVDAENNRVGIGTSSPSEKLVVIGNISVPGTIFIDNESGRVGIGATSPNVTFHVSGSANITGTLSVGSFEMSNAGAGTMNVSGQTTLATTAGNVGIGNTIPNVTLDVSGDANITGYLEVGSGLNVSNGMNVLTGNVIIGHTTNLGSGIGPLELNKGGDNGWLSLNDWDANDAEAFRVVFAKSGSNTIGTHTVVANNEKLGSIHFQGSDGTNFEYGADITAYVDGSPGDIAVDMPTRLVFSTLADNSNTLTERMTIKSDGNIGIGTTAPKQTLHVNGTGFLVTNTTGTENVFVFNATTGNVGIGNTIPNSTLTVTGEVNMTQNVTIFGMKIWNNGTYWCFNKC